MRLIAALLISIFYLLFAILLLLLVLPFIALKASLQCMHEYQAIEATIFRERFIEYMMSSEATYE